jgi:hypothetical protein
MGEICRAQCLYICPILYLYLLCPNACWSAGTVSPPGPAFLAYLVSARLLHTGSLDHDPHPSRVQDTSMESLTRLTDLCQAAAPTAAAPIGWRGLAKCVYHHVFLPTCPCFFEPSFTSTSRMAKPTTRIFLDRSSLHHLDSPPTASRVTWHAAPSGANRLPVE